MNNCSKTFIYLIVIALAIASVYAFVSYMNPKKDEVALSTVIEQVKNQEVSKILVSGNNLEISLKNGKKEFSAKEDSVSLTEYGIKPTDVQIDVKNGESATLWISLVTGILPILLIAGFIWFIFRSAQSGNNRALSFGKIQMRFLNGKGKKKTTFKDVAGLKEPKNELEEIVEFLKNPGKFRKLGAEIPKGVLLLGPPGVGKTLLAKAVAGEANVPFFSISASEFVEMFVGVGASRVRDLFDKAKKNSPSIVFVDELDAVGRQRGTGLGGSHDEREQTLNQILVEMDGFDTDTNVIVMAATNRPDVLDPALLRPGRFDRRVILDLPDVKEREAILKIHSRNKPLAEDVNFEDIAKITPGFSGADIENLMNEAAILAAQKDKSKIYQDDIERSIEKVMLGPERRSHMMSKNEKEITAYHEAGHAVVAHILPNADPVHKISLVSRGMALGYTLKLPAEDRKIHSKSQFSDELASLLGGRAAEELIFNEMTTGAQNDLREATKLARKMIKQFGMSNSLGPVTYGENEELVFLGRELGEHKNYSEETASKIDHAVLNIITAAEERAKKVLSKHKSELKKVTDKLLKDETINKKEFEAIFIKRNVKKPN
ncbi:MAG: ATP-dependent zinc metalloprotease FtsH [Candidatus Berkelbacteria bacterium]|nr:ATP-dependent zinc metalloprotease FtsH [Candidatus Berkelbacteria bacterium]